MNTRQAIEDRAKRIVQYYLRYEGDKKRTCAHFEDEGIPKRTILNVLKRFQDKLANPPPTDDEEKESFNLMGKKPLGRKPTVTTPEMFDKVSSLFREYPDLSCREAAKRLDLARTSIFRVIKKMKENGIEINKDIVSERRCPTCHQRIKDPTKMVKTKK